MPERKIEGQLVIGTPSGPVLPSGMDLMIDEVSIYQLFRPFEGKRVQVTLTVLDKAFREEGLRGPKTVRNLFGGS